MYAASPKKMRLEKKAKLETVLMFVKDPSSLADIVCPLLS